MGHSILDFGLITKMQGGKHNFIILKRAIAFAIAFNFKKAKGKGDGCGKLSRFFRDVPVERMRQVLSGGEAKLFLLVEVVLLQ